MSADVCFQKANFQESLHILNDIGELVKMVNEAVFPGKIAVPKGKIAAKEIFPRNEKREETSEEIYIEKELTTSYELLKDLG